LHLLTGRKGLQRRRRNVDLVAVDPEVAGAQAPFFVLFQPQRRQRLGN
jgi:hypothetical protein